MRRCLACIVVVALLLGGSMAIALVAEDSKSDVLTPSMLLGHNIFFSLKEPSEENKTKLIEACKARLSQHPGIIFFAVGTRDEKMSGTFNDKTYDVALHMIFTTREALGAYARTPDHQKFVVESTPLLKGLRIFDSAVEQVPNNTDVKKPD